MFEHYLHVFLFIYLDVISAEQLDALPSNENPAIETVSNSLPQSGESMDIEYEVCQVRIIYIELFPT
jgi:hypothetical protein